MNTEFWPVSISLDTVFQLNCVEFMIWFMEVYFIIIIFGVYVAVYAYETLNIN